VFPIAILFLCIFRLWLIWGIPKLQLYAPHDDQYFVKIATYISQGLWLGPYDNFTIIKVPFYAFFLILASKIPFPLLATETILYIFSSLICLLAISPISHNPWINLFWFTCILFCPVSLTTDFVLRVYREFVNLSLSLLVVSCMIGMIVRINKQPKTLIVWALGFGVSLGAFFITREEGLWISPIILLFTISFVFITIRKKDKSCWIKIGIVILPLIICQIPGWIISDLNWRYYGFYGTSETLDKDFNRVINTLGRIKTNTWTPYVQVSSEALQKAYLASPLMKSLKPELDKGLQDWRWIEKGTLAYKPKWLIEEYKLRKGDSGGGYLLWIFRDALAKGGYFSNGKYPREFLTHLGDELEQACSDETLTCRPNIGIPLISGIQDRHIPIIIRLLKDSLINMIRMDDIKVLDINGQIWQTYYVQTEFHYFTKNSPETEAYLLNNINSEEHQQIHNSLLLRCTIINWITKAYSQINFIMVAIALGLFLMCITALIKNKEARSKYCVGISVVVISGLLFLLRLTTLMIIEATTSNPAYNYRASVYLFLHLACWAAFLLWDSTKQQKVFFPKGK
jgi:hypothetical protein